MSDQVKIRILQHCMSYAPGQEVAVSKEEAEALCTIRTRHDGTKLVQSRVAMPMDEWEKIKKAPIDKGGMTQDEMEALGLKNIVPTPIDPAFEKKLEKIKNGTLGEISAPAKANKGSKKDSKDEEAAS